MIDVVLNFSLRWGTFCLHRIVRLDKKINHAKWERYGFQKHVLLESIVLVFHSDGMSGVWWTFSPWFNTCVMLKTPHKKHGFLPLDQCWKASEKKTITKYNVVLYIPIAHEFPIGSIVLLQVISWTGCIINYSAHGKMQHWQCLVHHGILRLLGTTHNRAKWP